MSDFDINKRAEQIRATPKPAPVESEWARQERQLREYQEGQTKEIMRLARLFAQWAKGRIPTNRTLGLWRRKGWLLAAQHEEGSSSITLMTHITELIVLEDGELIWNRKPLGKWRLMFPARNVEEAIARYVAESGERWPY